MASSSATLKNYRQSPRKVRVVSNLIKGKRVNDAMDTLEFVPKRAGLPILGLLKSAVANAKSKDISPDNLFVDNIRVDGGKILYRRRLVSRGSAHPIKKRTSQIVIFLIEKENKKKTRVKKESKNLNK